MKPRSMSILAGAIMSLIAACGGEPEAVDNYVVLGKADNGAPPAVQLVYADSWTHARYGQTSKNKTFIVRVQNMGYHKQVAIHHRTTTGQWVDASTSFVSSAGDNTEIWQTTIYGEGFDGKFVVKYAVEGVTYWDNNNGRDYHIGEADGPMLGIGIDVRLNAGYFTSFSGGIHSFRGTIDIRNKGYNKKVRVHYSTDGWQSEKVLDARFLGSFRLNGYGGVENPNSHGIEAWEFETQESAEKISYYVSYEVGGKTYRDTNYGENYTITKYNR